MKGAPGDEGARDGDGPACNEAARDQAAREEVARDEAVRDEAVREQAVREQAAVDEAARDEAAVDASAAPVGWAIAWRHPRADGAAGRCIGARSDLPVDPRRAKRLAYRIRAVARRERLPRVVAASPARRCRAVARWLRRFGFVARIDARLREFDFGAWDGRRWDAIGRDALEAWGADFATHAPGGGDTLAAFVARVRAVRADPPAALLVTHGGWLSALRWLDTQGAQAAAPPLAADWPAAPACGCALRWRPQAAADSGAAATARGAPGAGVLGR